MLKMHLAAGLAATALMTAAAVAQTTPAPAGGSTTAAQTAPAGAGQVMTQMSANLMRGSKLMGVDVYGTDNQKIGDVDEVLVDQEGKIQAIVVGVGGFLGIGEKNVAIPYNQVQWMSSEQAQTAANTQAGSGTNTAGGVTTPAAPAGSTASTANQPATTGSTAGTTTAGARSDDNTPARAMVRMTKADLQNAPEFRYSMNEGGSAAGAGGTNPPPANRPAAPQQ